MGRTSKSIINYLPEDVLCQIFIHLDQCDLKSTSLVCKLFCSLSSTLLDKLHLLKHSSLTYSDFRRLFKRFPGLKNMYINISGPKLDNFLMAISNSGLNLEELRLCSKMNSLKYPEQQTMEVMSTSKVIKSIKSLHLNHGFGRRRKQQQLIKFISMFPWLIEFDFTYLWDENGIHKVTLKFPNLRKISFSCNDRLTDKTLDILSSNCPKLESVNFQDCGTFTLDALHTFFCNNPQLSSVDMPCLYSPSISKVVECIQVLRNLNHLSLECDIVQDAVLIVLAKLRPPLKSLRLKGSDKKYTMAGLILLLSACPGLEKLNIFLPFLHCENNNTHDAEMSIVVKRLPKLKHIELCFRTDVCQSTLFSLVQNCPLLEILLVECVSKANVKQVFDQGMTRPTKRNYSIKSIFISPKDSNILLLSTLELYCPNLR
ncbi:hypothetical protein QQ045_020235 [Rhodiola kirilowii]